MPYNPSFLKISASAMTYPELVRILLKLLPLASKTGILVLNPYILASLLQCTTATATTKIKTLTSTGFIQLLDPHLGTNIFTINAATATTLNHKSFWKTPFKSPITPAENTDLPKDILFFQIAVSSIEAISSLSKQHAALLFQMALAMNQKRGLITLKSAANKLPGSRSDTRERALCNAIDALAHLHLIKVIDDCIAINAACISTQASKHIHHAAFASPLFTTQPKTHLRLYAGIPTQNPPATLRRHPNPNHSHTPINTIPLTP